MIVYITWRSVRETPCMLRNESTIYANAPNRQGALYSSSLKAAFSDSKCYEQCQD
jgi:hypothetical protein